MTVQNIINLPHVIWENGLVGILLPNFMTATIECMEIIQILNSFISCILWCIDLKLAETFQNGVIYIV